MYNIQKDTLKFTEVFDIEDLNHCLASYVKMVKFIPPVTYTSFNMTERVALTFILHYTS